MARFLKQYREQVVPQLVSQFGYKSVMEVPRITKVTLNMGVGEAVVDKKNIDAAVPYSRCRTPDSTSDASPSSPRPRSRRIGRTHCSD